jgi:hypothetical protein
MITQMDIGIRVRFVHAISDTCGIKYEIQNNTQNKKRR